VLAPILRVRDQVGRPDLPQGLDSVADLHGGRVAEPRRVPYDNVVEMLTGMVAGWGNPPANPPTYECVKVLDATGHVLPFGLADEVPNLGRDGSR
jgi:hypothetical protein